jgi:putative endopeptidase
MMIKPMLLAACAPLAAFATFAVPAHAQASALAPPPAPAVAETDWGRAGLQMQWADPAVKPGDDFFTHINGKWIASHEIPADQTSTGSFRQLRDLSEARLHDILVELAAKKPAAGTQEARIVASSRPARCWTGSPR